MGDVLSGDEAKVDMTVNVTFEDILDGAIVTATLSNYSSGSDALSFTSVVVNQSTVITVRYPRL